MALAIGIAGLPNVSRSTTFNALTHTNVLAADCPFATIGPNVGVVPPPDRHLSVLTKMFNPQKIVPTVVSFVDIAGIVKGASKGEDLGNQFLANTHEADAICQVTRAFTDLGVVHVEGKVDPASDIETVFTKLILADLQTLEETISHLRREVSSKKTPKEVLAAAEQCEKILDPGHTPSSAVTAGELNGEPVRES